MDLSTIDLPTGTHAAMLGGRDVVTGEQLARTVVWADRPYDRCPRCREPVNQVVVDCPVTLDTGACQGGQLEEWDKQHGCGEWLAVDCQEVTGGGATGDVTSDDVVVAATKLAASLAEAIDHERHHLRAGLRRDLAWALARLAEPLQEWETPEGRAEEARTGDELNPGVYQEDGTWLAWAYDPDGSGDPIVVTVQHLTAEAPHG
jgi:hypothetical protein